MSQNYVKEIGKFKIELDSKIKNYSICPLCLNALISLHNSIFNFSLEGTNTEEMFNILLMILRFFEIRLIDESNPKSKERNIMYHLFHNNISFCKSPLKDLVDFYKIKLEETQLEEKQTETNLSI